MRLLRACVVLTLLLTPPEVVAQVEYGGLYGTVTDDQGATLPGVSISLSGVGATQQQISDDQGNFRFPRLDPGLYNLKAELNGFSPLEQASINIRAGRTTSLALEVSAAIEAAISVTAESPLLDERNLSQGTVVSSIDLENVPTAGDPYALLNQAPGVLVDRIDVGGSRNSRTLFTAPGVRESQNDFLIDGVQITDPRSEGKAHIYFDLEQFSQVDLSTGGNDISKATAGVSVNLVTKRGTNEFRGSARYLVTDDDLFWFFKQSSPDVDPDEFPPRQETEFESTQINSIQNYGLEAGGPLIQNRLWFWGSWNRNAVSETAVGGFPRDNYIQQIAAKVNAQVSRANSLVASVNQSEKHEDNLGHSFSRSVESSHTLDSDNPDGLIGRGVALLKLEDTQVFSSHLFLTGAFSQFDGGWALTANGCVSAGSCENSTETLWDANGIWQNSFWSGSTARPSSELKLDGSYFFGAGKTSHELKFGGRYRQFESTSPFYWPGGRNIAHYSGALFDFPGGLGFFEAARGSGPPVNQDFTSLWVQDTLTIGAWTLNAGLRYDLQQGENPALIVPANPALPEFLPALDFAGNDGGGFDWQSISPRLGITYALGEERQTLLRGSYSRFASALGALNIAHVNPVASSVAYFLFLDDNGNEMWDGREEEFELVDWYGYDPEDPANLSSPNRTDPDLDPELTDEVVVGVERSFLPELVVGMNVTWRKTSDILEYRDFLRERDSGQARLARRSDYIFDHSTDVGQPDGQIYAADFYVLDPSRFDYTGGSLQLNGDRRVEYLGASLSLTKRLSHQWMARGFINYGKPTWDIPDSFFEFDDPTDYDAINSDRYDNDGDLFAEGAGRFRRLILQSAWSFNLNGMYQIAPDRPWGFNLAGNVYGREGYPFPIYVQTGTPQGSKRAQAMAVADDFRYDDLYTVDLRVEKEFAAWGNSSFVLSADVFNALNSGVVLERETRMNAFVSNFVLETLSPRIWRLGIRINWR